MPAAIALAAITVITYANSFTGVFVFDDRVAVARNPEIRALSPLTNVLSMSEQTTLSGRPVATLSFALNYALAPADVRNVFEEPPAGSPPFRIDAFYRNLWHYHAANLLVHVLAALVLLAIVRRTLAIDPDAALAGVALPVAFVAAAVWAVHPLQTSAVTYVMQRVESLMALFYLLTIYCAIRSWEARRRWLWIGGAVVSCALAMGTKEVAVTAPVMVGFWDWFFARDSGGGKLSPRELVSQRWPLYTGLAATWVILAFLLGLQPRGASVGFGFAEWPWTTYLMTQAQVVVHYLRLALIPSPLVLDYAWAPVGSLRDVWWESLLILLLVLAAASLAWRRHPAGFPLMWLLLILAPSSSVVPIATQPAAEHRMYLPLAGIVALIVIGVVVAGRRVSRTAEHRGVVRRAAMIVAAALVLLFGRMTAARNLDYRDYGRMWRDTMEKRPANARARNNYATQLLEEGRFKEAEQQFRAAVALNPRSAESQANLGVALCMSRAYDECLERLRQALLIEPRYRPAYRDLGEAYASLGLHGLAVQNYLHALELGPDDVFLLNRSGWLLATSTEAGMRDAGRALALAQRAVALTNRRDVTSLDTLAAAQAEAGRFEEALATAQGARSLAAATGQPEMAAEIDKRIDRYRARQPMREAPLAPDRPSR